jgi:ankyrin repeat protein
MKNQVKYYRPIKEISHNRKFDPILTTKLFMFVQNGNLQDIKEFIFSNNLTTNIKNDSDENLLHVLLKSNTNKNIKFDIMVFLIEKGININEHDKYDITPLHLAVKTYDEKIVKYLLSKGADPNVFNNQNKTPLHYAVTGSLSMLDKEKKIIPFKKIKENIDSYMFDSLNDFVKLIENYIKTTQPYMTYMDHIQHIFDKKTIYDTYKPVIDPLSTKTFEDLRGGTADNKINILLNEKIQNFKSDLDDKIKPHQPNGYLYYLNSNAIFDETKKILDSTYNNEIPKTVHKFIELLGLEKSRFSKFGKALHDLNKRIIIFGIKKSHLVVNPPDITNFENLIYKKLTFSDHHENGPYYVPYVHMYGGIANLNPTTDPATYMILHPNIALIQRNIWFYNGLNTYSTYIFYEKYFVNALNKLNLRSQSLLLSFSMNTSDIIERDIKEIITCYLNVLLSFTYWYKEFTLIKKKLSSDKDINFVFDDGRSLYEQHDENYNIFMSLGNTFDILYGFIKEIDISIKKIIMIINNRYSLEYISTFNNNFAPNYFTTLNTSMFNDLYDNFIDINYINKLPNSISELLIEYVKDTLLNSQTNVIDKYCIQLTNKYVINRVTGAVATPMTVGYLIDLGVPIHVTKGIFGVTPQITKPKSDTSLKIVMANLDLHLRIIKYDFIQNIITYVWNIYTTGIHGNPLFDCLSNLKNDVELKIHNTEDQIILSVIAKTINKYFINFVLSNVSRVSEEIITQHDVLRGGDKYDYSKVIIDFMLNTNETFKVVIPNFGSLNSQISNFVINTDVTKLLLDSNADIEAKDLNGDTPLYSAIDIGHFETINILIDRNATLHNPSYVNNNGKTAYHHALEHYIDYLSLETYDIKHLSKRYNIQISDLLEQTFNNEINIKDSELFIQIALYLINNVIYQLHTTNYNGWTNENKSKLNTILSSDEESKLPIYDANKNIIIKYIKNSKVKLNDDIIQLEKENETIKITNIEKSKENIISIEDKKLIFNNNTKIEKNIIKINEMKKILKRISSEKEYDIDRIDRLIKTLQFSNENITNYISSHTGMDPHVLSEFNEAVQKNNELITQLTNKKTNLELLIRPIKISDIIGLVNYDYPIVKTYDKIAETSIGILTGDYNVYIRCWRNLFVNNKVKDFTQIIENIMQFQNNIFINDKTKKTDEIIFDNIDKLNILNDFNMTIINKFVNDYFVADKVIDNDNNKIIISIIEHLVKHIILPKLIIILRSIVADKYNKTIATSLNQVYFNIYKHIVNKTSILVSQFLGGDETELAQDIFKIINERLQKQTNVVINDDSEICIDINKYVVPYFIEYIKLYVTYTKQAIDEYLKLLLYQSTNLRIILLLTSKLLEFQNK